MKLLFAGFILILFCAKVVAQNEITIEPADVINSAEQLLRENVDTNALEALGVDTERAQNFLDELKKRFEGTYVYDLGALRETAMQLLPVLQQYEETEPYAIWLKTHLDYFEVAEKLRKEASRGVTNPAPQLVAPSAKTERKAWIEVVEERPMPPLASKQVAQLKKIFVAEKIPPELGLARRSGIVVRPESAQPGGCGGLVHPEKNARAAAHYLRQLYGRFGDWRLTLAAYNAGESRVANLLAKNKMKTFDAIANRLPAETQMFVPKVEAIVRKREGRALADLRMPRR